MTGRPKTSGLAIAALVCSFLCLPLGLVLGIVALVQIGRSGGALEGKGLAIASIVISGALIPVTLGIMAAIAVPNFYRYQNRSKQAEARTYLQMIRSAQQMVRAEQGRYLPAAAEGNTPDATRAPWPGAPCSSACTPEDPSACDTFACLDVAPMGEVFYRYACEVTEDGQDFTCAALGDLDGDGEHDMLVLGTGDPTLVAPIPDFDGRAVPCPDAVPDQVVDCNPQVF